jgi:hypothetical protein
MTSFLSSAYAGPRGGALAIDGPVPVGKRPAFDAFDAIGGFAPFSSTSYGLASIFRAIRAAPLANGEHLDTIKGHPWFLYKPDKNLTGDDNTVTAFGLQGVNYGLEQRAIYEQLLLDGTPRDDVSREISAYKAWPLTVDEFLDDKKIVYIGIRSQSPGERRGEYEPALSRAQVAGLVHRVPWIWGNVVIGSRVGFRVANVHPKDVSHVTVKGSDIASPCRVPFLQVAPHVLGFGFPYRGGKRLSDSPAPHELDYVERFRVRQQDVAPDENGLPLGARTPSEDVFGCERRGFGFFVSVGTVTWASGKSPYPRGVVHEACRSFGAMNALVRNEAVVDLKLDPHPTSFFRW